MNKLWVFQANRYFTEEENTFIQKFLEEVLKEWNTHGKLLQSEYKIVYNHFIIIIVHEENIKASGCAIDDLTREIKQLEQELNISLLNRMEIAYKKDEKKEILPLNTFKNNVKEGLLDGETIIFNNSVSTIEDFERNWEIPLKDSWAKNLLP